MLVQWSTQVDQIAAWINAKLDKFYAQNDPDECEEKALAEEIMKALLAHNLAYQKVVHALKVGVHPKNRFTTMLHTPHVHELLVDFVRMGWSRSSQLGRSTGFETLPGEAGEEQRKKNAMLYRAADGLLGELEKWCLEDLEIMSVSSSHSAAAVRLPLLGAKAAESTEQFAPRNSRISVEFITSKKPSMADPMTNGFEWTIIRAQMEMACPRLPHFLQAAYNADHGVEKVQTALQRMQQIHAMAVENKAKQGHEQWDSISNIVASNARMTVGEVN